MVRMRLPPQTDILCHSGASPPDPRHARSRDLPPLKRAQAVWLASRDSLATLARSISGLRTRTHGSDSPGFIEQYRSSARIRWSTTSMPSVSPPRQNRCVSSTSGGSGSGRRTDGCETARRPPRRSIVASRNTSRADGQPSHPATLRRPNGRADQPMARIEQHHAESFDRMRTEARQEKLRRSCDGRLQRQPGAAAAMNSVAAPIRSRP